MSKDSELDPAVRRRADIVTVALARQITNDSIVVMGTGTPLTAVATLLALATHAPRAHYTSPLAGGLSVAPHEVSLERMEEAVFEHAVLRSAQIIDLWELATINPKTKDRWVQFLRPAQIDRTGAMNNSRIRRADGTWLQLPGSVGISDMAAFYPRLYAYVPRHAVHVFPQHVDFVSAPGTLGTEADRRRRGLRWGRPYLLVTDMGVFGYDERGFMEVRGMHPGVTAADIEQATGFPLTFADDTETAAPTAEEHAALDAVDPSGLRCLEVLPARERRALLRSRVGQRATTSTDVR